MSDDILERLRAPSFVSERDVQEALAEITRLREQIRLLTEDMPAGDARRILAEQHAEIERLRLAAGQ